MKAYTYRIAHLELIPEIDVGDIIQPDQKIGRMGNTGKSKWPHLHQDVIHGFITKIVRLKQIGYEPRHIYTPSIEQLNHFTDKGLFHYPLIITTPYYDPQYKIDWKKDHPAYDVVPEDRKRTTDHFDIYWNRTKIEGILLFKGFDYQGGYGNYALIGFEV